MPTAFIAMARSIALFCALGGSGGTGGAGAAIAAARPGTAPASAYWSTLPFGAVRTARRFPLESGGYTSTTPPDGAVRMSLPLAVLRITAPSEPARTVTPSVVAIAGAAVLAVIGAIAAAAVSTEVDTPLAIRCGRS